MGMLGSLALIIQYFPKQNTYLKNNTDSCHARYKDGHSEVISSLQVFSMFQVSLIIRHD